ncbi:MAG: hypothetical protein ACD_48C00604G0003 [uncultured bacterium]|uniref:Fe-S cluster assembly ATPase SufC n=1 Tax=Candidatus Gottesmanbacteria bacterium RIFCSPLOWO2_01_FULL_43_11b TaxID=1798392 RepID=A0A1F6AI02_9BACT|nr:MAG: hypothetical protein ACD_48C00604G0003 [uncultured bacterium]OGG24354.1 MAG: Fe-S cluster assembly ATPase SufC [Candidatus Gottesmanbacteria bacterium RIFCSPLOWO2_01_FULL_43_11b]
MKLTLLHLQAFVSDKQIIHNVSLTLQSGEIHAVMGPNGSGKSTLAYALMAHPSYRVKGKIILNNKEITKYSTEERAKRGIFMALQSPIAIPGVTVINLLRTSYQELHGSTSSPQVQNKRPIQNPLLSRRWKAAKITLSEFTDTLRDHAKALHIDESFLSRGINDGFSGGEKKKMEMLQALTLQPKFAIFDEIDTGLDVDALKTVAYGIESLKKKGVGILIITHYQRILKYLKPDYVHVLVDGKIVKSGKAVLAEKIESEGYDAYR